MRSIRLWVTATLLAISVTPVFASPAGACSCAPITDIEASVGDSEAAFVGTLVETRDGGAGDFGPESIHVFEVEEWVKGEGGDILEVRSPSDGAACGLEFWDPDQRVGALLYEVDGELQAGLCGQIDPDVLLATMTGPTPSSTGIGFLLAGHGWSSTGLSVLDEAGHHVTDLNAPGEAPEWTGTQMLKPCPGGDLIAQMTPSTVFVWDMARLEVVASHDLSALSPDGWGYDISCRDAEASSIYVLVAEEFDGYLVEIVPEVTTLIDLPGNTGGIGTDFVVTQSVMDGAVNWVDLATGESRVLVENPQHGLRSLMVAAHPSERRVAVLDTRAGAGFRPDESQLSILDDVGQATHVFEVPEGAYQPTWLDDSRLLVNAYTSEDSEESAGAVFDTVTGETTLIEDWYAEHAAITGDTVYGVSGGTIFTADLGTGEMGKLVTLPSQSAGPLLVLGDIEVAAAPSTVPDPGTTQPTAPPLVAPDVKSETDGLGPALQWIAGTAIIAFLGLLVLLSLRPTPDSDG